MPIYEYRCNSCRKKVAVFTRSTSHTPTPICDRCYSSDLRRLISAFAVHKSWGESLDWMPSSDAMDEAEGEENPKATAQWLRRMKSEMGETTHEFDEMIDMMEAGEMPEDGDTDTNDDLS